MNDYFLNHSIGELIINQTHAILSDSNSLNFHRSLEFYQESPLINLENLSNKLGVSKLFVKDESNRFELNSFKVLGAS